MNIYLVGYRCSGKTTLGQLLAAQLGWPFVDTDSRVVAQAGMDIAALVKENGWGHFRGLERACLEAVAAKAQQVVATGGGIVLDPQNVQTMQSSGVVVWLKASPGIIRKRMRSDAQTKGQRPALSHQNAVEEIETVLQTRTPLYLQARNIELNTDGKPVENLVRQLVARLRSNRIMT